MSSIELKDIYKEQFIHTAFFKSAEFFGDKILFGDKGGKGKHYTYAEVSNYVQDLSAGIRQKYGDGAAEIGLISENRPEWGIAYLAILAAGKTVIPIDANLTRTEIKFIIENSKLSIIFASQKFELLLKEISCDLIVISLEESSPDSWMKMLVVGNQELSLNLNLNLNLNQTAVLIYTSGTTGIPKAVELTHKNLLANLEAISKSIYFDHNDTFLSILPLHHTFEATCGFLTPIMSGAKIVYARSYKSNEIREDLKYNRATVMTGVPLLYEKFYHTIRKRILSTSIIKRALFHILYFISSNLWKMNIKVGGLLFKSMRDKGGLGSIRMFVSGGAAIPPSIVKFFNIIGISFLQGYGMTEASPVISVNRIEDLRFGSVGPLVEGVEVKIENPDDTGIGEIFVKGDNITPGYRNNPKATAELFSGEWMKTGDLGCLKDGHLWITGRSKSLIISAAGKNIYPEELEEKLLEDILVMETVVFGRIKEGKQGEEVRALIVPDMEVMVSEHAISKTNPDMIKIRSVIKTVIDSINSQVAAYKRISAFDVQFEELEKTSKKSIRRFLYK
ncbi:MAG: AMP-binding protein [bacterium]